MPPDGEFSSKFLESQCMGKGDEQRDRCPTLSVVRLFLTTRRTLIATCTHIRTSHSTKSPTDPTYTICPTVNLGVSTGTDQ